MIPVRTATRGLLLAALSLVPTLLSGSSPPVPDIPNIAAYFGTKSRYEEVKPELLRDVLSVNRTVLRPPPGESCSPVHLTAVIRHGTRYPTLKNIRRIQKLSELVRREASRGSGSSEGWLRDLRTWESWYTEDMDGESPGLVLIDVDLDVLEGSSCLDLAFICLDFSNEAVRKSPEFT